MAVPILQDDVVQDARCADKMLGILPSWWLGHCRARNCHGAILHKCDCGQGTYWFPHLLAMFSLHSLGKGHVYCSLVLYRKCVVSAIGSAWRFDPELPAVVCFLLVLKAPYCCAKGIFRYEPLCSKKPYHTMKDSILLLLEACVV